MRLFLKFQTKSLLTLLIFALVTFSYSQNDTEKIKALVALGINSPSSSGFVDNFASKGINFPTINLGLQYMFSKSLGARLDYGYNRITNSDESIEFKSYYSRINAQAVFNASSQINTGNRVATYLHAGPGYSISRPLGVFKENKTTFLNAMAGVEFHYGLSDSVSLFVDTSYIVGFGKDFTPIETGFGAFNGNMLTVTFGAAISLSGCYFCRL